VSSMPKEFRHNAKKPLMLLTKDKAGETPPTRYLNSIWRHTGNKKVYTLMMFCWLGETDRWGFIMTTDDSNVPVVRPLEHLLGNRSDGSKRYELIQDFPGPDDDLLP